MTTPKRRVYSFGAGKAMGGASMRELLGGKGAGLHEMTRLGVPVPPGFTISTEVCTYFYTHGQRYPSGLKDEVESALQRVEKIMHRRFGDPDNPLLVSVRSGARESMPGMMDYDSYRRFVHMYGDVVLGLKPESKEDRDPFELILEKKKGQRGVHDDTELGEDDLQELVVEFKEEIERRTGKPFPEGPMEQLWGAIGAVFGSWNNERAVAYRKLYRIPHEWGTAVNVQTMVFGNMGDSSATGVAFTRNPSTGENKFYGEFLINAQGEDVVAGIRTPQPIEELKRAMPHRQGSRGTLQRHAGYRVHH